MLGGAVVFVLVVFGVAYWQWTRLAYWFDDDGDLRVTSGVLQRRERRLQLSRLQSVDVVQPLLARVFGMAEVKVEVAGSGDSRITLQYLTIDAAQALRSETLARAAGVRPDAGEAPEEVLVNVPSDVLLKAGLLNTGVWLTLLIELGAIAVVIGTAGLGGLALIVALVLPLFGVFGFFASYFNFTVAASPDGLRTRYGLLGVQAHRAAGPGGVAGVRRAAAVAPFRLGDGAADGRRRGPIRWRQQRRLGRHAVTGGHLAGRHRHGGAVAARRRRLHAGADGGAGAGAPTLTVPVAHVGPGLRRLGRHHQARLADAAHHGDPARPGAVGAPHPGTVGRALALSSVHFDVVPGPVKAVALHRPQEEAAAVLLTELAHMRREAERDASIRWGRRRPQGLG